MGGISLCSGLFRPVDFSPVVLNVAKKMKVTQNLEAKTRLIQTKNMSYICKWLINPWNNTLVKASSSSEITHQKLFFSFSKRYGRCQQMYPWNNSWEYYSLRYQTRLIMIVLSHLKTWALIIVSKWKLKFWKQIWSKLKILSKISADMYEVTIIFFFICPATWMKMLFGVLLLQLILLS